MAGLDLLEADLHRSLPPDLAGLAPDLARTLTRFATRELTLDRARNLLTQPTIRAILRERLTSAAANSPAGLVVGDKCSSQGIAIGPGAHVIYQGPGYSRPDN